MRNLTIATTIAAGLSAAAVGLSAPALAAPTGGNADQTISRLEAQGNRVVVNRLSDAPLSQATVVGINKGGDLRSTVRDYFNDRTYQQSKTGGSIYYVDVR